MAKRPPRGAERPSIAGREPTGETLRRSEREIIDRFLRGPAIQWLDLPNIVDVAAGTKYSGGVDTGVTAIIFGVVVKFADKVDIVRAGTRPIPAEIDLGDGCVLPTDIVESSPMAHPGFPGPRETLDPVRGGCSAGDAHRTGTLGGIVRRSGTNSLVGLSNAHVFPGQGDPTFQPGPGDAGAGAPLAKIGRVLASALDSKVDAAITSIETRGIDTHPLALGVAITSIGRATAGLAVVKVGKQTGVTHGLVTTEEGPVSIPIGGISTKMVIATIEPNPAFPSASLSEAGDSGSCWMEADAQGHSTGKMVALNVGGGNGGKKAYACQAPEVFARLGIEPLGADAAELAWKVTPPSEAFAVQGVPYTVTARHGLLVRGGAGTEFPAIGGRPLGARVHVLGREGPWFMVDLAGDGVADGFMYSPFLKHAPEDASTDVAGVNPLE